MTIQVIAAVDPGTIFRTMDPEAEAAALRALFLAVHQTRLSTYSSGTFPHIEHTRPHSYQYLIVAALTILAYDTILNLGAEVHSSYTQLEGTATVLTLV